MAVRSIDEWKRLIGDRQLVDYTFLSKATGLSPNSLRTYAAQGRMPKPDGRGVWLAHRDDLARWVIGESRPGQGARTDLRTEEDT